MKRGDEDTNMDRLQWSLQVLRNNPDALSIILILDLNLWHQGCVQLVLIRF